MRIGVVLVNMALHIFDHDDGVIDHQAGGQRDAEQGQRIDGEAENLDERKGADQRNRDGDRRDDGRAPVEQEEEDNDDDDDDRLLPACVTTSLMESPTTVVVSKAIYVLNSRRKRLGQLDQRGLGCLVDLQRIGIATAAARRRRWRRGRCSSRLVS